MLPPEVPLHGILQGLAATGRKAVPGHLPDEVLIHRVHGEAFHAEGEAFRLQIPWEWPDPAAWDLRVYGRLETEAGGMSFHALEEENQAHSWQAGGVYTFQAPQGFTELWLEAALEGEARTVDLLPLGR